MEKNLPSTPKTPKAVIKPRRVHHTPDTEKKMNTMPPTSTRCFTRTQSTTSIYDTLNMTSGSTVKKKVINSRASLAPSSLVNTFGLKKNETDNAETELGLLYSDYLRTQMADVLLEKKALDNEKKILNQLASLSKESDLKNEKLSKMKAREKDIRYLSTLQNYSDTLMTQIKIDFDAFKKSLVKDDLEKLKNKLEPFDFLRCQGIDLPSSADEQKQFVETLNECCKSVQEVSELIDEKGDNLHKVKTALQGSIEILKKLENLQKNLHSSMNSLQISVMKNVSQNLSENVP